MWCSNVTATAMSPFIWGFPRDVTEIGFFIHFEIKLWKVTIFEKLTKIHYFKTKKGFFFDLVVFHGETED